MSSNILQHFYKTAQQWPHKTALIDKQGAYSFEELAKLVQQKAQYFNGQNIQAGDRVLVLVPMSRELYINVLALFHIGAVAVFVDQWADKKRILQSCELAQCKALIAGLKLRLLSYFFKATRNIPLKLNAYSTHDYPQTLALYDAAPEHPALITFTTGSTGVPKAPVRTHKILAAQFDALVPLLHAEDDEVIDMPMLPIVLLLNLGIGRTSVIADFNPRKPALFDSAHLLQQCIQHKVNSITASPFYLEQLAQYQKRSNSNFRFKYLFSGGGPIFPPLVALLNEYLCAESQIVFGSTEAEPIAHIYSKDLALNFASTQKGLCVGKIDKAAQVKILRITHKTIDATYFKENECGINEYGEICVSGAHVVEQYYNNEAAFLENKIIDEQGKLWHRTGDCGYLNEDSFLFLLGRSNQIIEKKDKFYFPFIIESELLQIEAISIGTLIIKNNELLLALQLKENTDEVSLKLALQARSVAYDKLILLPHIPRDPRHHTKIDYKALELLL
jgi:olefin beta-lactone synthetase